MNEHDVEPILKVLLWPQHPDPPIPKLVAESDVFDVPDPKHRELGRALAKQHRGDRQSLLGRFRPCLVRCEIGLAEIVELSGDGENVDRG